MDERLELTKEQNALADKFNELCEQMNRAGIGFIVNGEDLYLINTQKVEKWVPTEEMVSNVENNTDLDEELIDFNDMFWCDIEFFYYSYWEDNVGIRFK